MLTFNIVAGICLAYVAILFGVAALAEQWAQKNKMTFLKSPIVYTLSISVYCTAWTFYGAVGSAARNGLEFLAIYVGPTLVFVGWWWLLRKLVRIGRTQRITSIADLISSRYGKSNLLAVVVTLLAVIGTTPYIALQLQSLTLSFAVFTENNANAPSPAITALLIAIGLAAFTVVFGTRNLDANERHHGVVTAIALEAVVKLIALLAVGIFVVWFVADGPKDILQNAEEIMPKDTGVFNSRWVTLTFLSATAIICLPRMFQVVVVENDAESHLATASWAFPLYLFLMCLFVVPIAVVGQEILPEGSNPDLFVLTVPLAMGQESIAALAFLGGFSSATSMVIVAAIALSTMVSNHIVLPLWLYRTHARNPESDDVRSILLRSRRISIAGILALGYFYYRFTGGTSALASIGLIAFLGIAQVLPALFFGLFWKNASRSGALAGILVGFTIWAYTLFLPSFGDSFLLSKDTIENGLFGLSALRPQALLGVEIEDPLVHAVFWSMCLNLFAFVSVSLFTSPKPLENLQALEFTNVFGRTSQRHMPSQITTSDDLFILAQRILGRTEAGRLFEAKAKEQGKPSGLPDPTSEFIITLEREFAGSVGAATAHAMVGQISGRDTVSVEELIAVADETAQVMEYSARLEKQSKELAATAKQLRRANNKLTKLSQQKDDFLSQVSHELRTPMTSIRSFSAILMNDGEIDRKQFAHFSSIINDESQRLTRILDDILDLSFLESGKVKLNLENRNLGKLIEQSITASQTAFDTKEIKVNIPTAFQKITLFTDADRLAQVFINLITNAIKYNDKDVPVIDFSVAETVKALTVTISDNGPGVSEADQEIIFEKFSKLSSGASSSGVGLGLSICAEIMRNLGGDVVFTPSKTGAMFTVTIPRTSKSRDAR
ncbi:sodium:solute symporter [Amylibacter sp. SFDW26]|uniref:sodium:solute symporter family transporter n=1 Tax=Amylibacter sp. SFDW26 TaxID=2652722 RepID=UPI0012623AF0|nr:ATP-binding protein [Amylibacter sp. SFDW26]KAB7614700.1 sodium:solute symporter [Amylibacter sp. SFDW26]